MNPVLDELLKTQRVLGPDGCSYPLHSYVPHLEGKIIQAWIEKYQPRCFLEIGMAYAISTLHICDAIQNLKEFESYHVVDPYQLSKYNDLGLYNLQRAGYGQLIILHRKRSETCLPELWSEGIRFDLVFIDGHHSFENVFVDYFYASRMLNRGGTLIFDDVQIDGVKKVIEHVETRDEFQSLALPVDFENDRTIRLRRLTGNKSSRIVGFQKR